jgi:Mrp family chromosome partitioning ATPase
LHAYLAEVRREFEYSIVAAPPAGESNEALAMAQFADGIILVLSAMHTRRVTARKIAEVLAQVRLLGTVLADREFPMPEGIYRRL